MSIFGNIMSAIFHHNSAGAQAAPTAARPTASPTPSSPAPSSQTGGTAAPPAAGQPAVDVEAVLTKLSYQNNEKLDWRRSIVDLMKLLNLDSGLTARKE